MLVLLSYATWLSWRIRRLSRAAEHALSPQGEIRAHLPSAQANDEIGDLSRSFSTSLQRISDYNHYLQSLANKLAHELRTPLAIVKSSLELLQQQTLPDTAKPYTNRALKGSERLQTLLQAMSEATHVEHSIQHAEPERVDLTALLEEISSAYHDSYQHRFITAVPEHPCELHGSPDLLVQMLDKLVDNAAHFSPPQQPIRLTLTHHHNHYQLDIRNHGPALPNTLQERLFESLVSIRSAPSEQPHMGLGLYIVKLIVNHHNGHVSAHNTDDGVCFRVCLPSLH